MNAIRCAQCGYDNAPDAQACRRCGSPLQRPAPAQASRPGTVSFRQGQVLANRYRVIELIARGGMGAIYRVHDNVLREEVALKTLLPQFARDKTIVERFYNEARIARQLSHPNIVRVHDIGMAGSIMYISMEYLQGRSLRAMTEHLPSGERLPIRAVLDVFDQLCAALEYAHRYTVHRDIKPENVMVTSDGTAKLLDFGISKLFAHAQLTMPDIVMGTPQYMAPEQFQDSAKVDGRADIYSLGVVLYEVLTGTLPTVMSKPVSQMSQVPATFDPIVAKCLEADPDRRYQTVSELREALKAAQSFAEPSPVPGLVTPAPRRSLLGRTLVVAGIAAVVLLTGVGLWKQMQGRNDTPPGSRGAVLATDPLGQYRQAMEAARQRTASLITNEARARLKECAEDWWNRAEAGQPTEEITQRAAIAALQCYAGLALWDRWNADDSMVFVPPGEALMEDEKGSCRVWTGAFFMDRRRVRDGAFLNFAQNVVGGWPMPAYYRGGYFKPEVLPEVLESPVHAIPFYYAQAYAAWAGGKVPSEAQWVRALEAQRSGEVALEDLEGPFSEWTRTRYAPLPYSPEENREDPNALKFGVALVVREPITRQENASSVPKRSFLLYEEGTQGAGFRCVKEIPGALAELANLFTGSP